MNPIWNLALLIGVASALPVIDERAATPFRDPGTLVAVGGSGSFGCVTNTGKLTNENACATLTTQWDGDSFTMKMDDNTCFMDQDNGTPILKCAPGATPQKFTSSQSTLLKDPSENDDTWGFKQFPGPGQDVLIYGPFVGGGFYLGWFAKA